MPIALLTRLAYLFVPALLAGTCLSAAAKDTDVALTEQIAGAVRRQSAWIAEAKQCPAQLMTRSPVSPLATGNACMKNPTTACLASCERGDAAACYWLGQGLQQRNAPDRAFEALYQRSCKLGVISGCTNRAAGMMVEQRDNAASQQCASRTFEKGCGFDDPWACTMQAFHLSYGLGVAPDPARALQLLRKSCKYGQDDPACIAGIRLKQEIEGAKK